MKLNDNDATSMILFNDTNDNDTTTSHNDTTSPFAKHSQKISLLARSYHSY